jgi:hypothetical protein
VAILRINYNLVAEGDTVQQQFFPELPEEPVLSAPSICPYEAVPLPPATPVLADFESDTDLELESGGQDAWPDHNALPESLDVFKVSTHMLKASNMGAMDVIDDQEERIEEDEPEYVPHKKQKVTIRYGGDVSPPPEGFILAFLEF